MEEEMVEDAANDDIVEYSFTAYEIDLDYEYDAARFFDFCRAESSLEARQAEVWFHSAGSYPPSPFVARLVPRDEMSMEDISICPSAKDIENMHYTECDSDIEGVEETLTEDMSYRDGEGQDNGTCTTLQDASGQKFQNPNKKLPSGLTLFNHMVDNSISKTETKSSKKPSFPRSSTLMKPTASQLAKQNGPFLTGYPRSTTSFVEKTAKSSGTTSTVENQAAKRQKLENGHLRKVVDAMQLQQTSYVHKAPNQGGLLDGNRTHSKGRNTISRDPDLETARRALRTRSKYNKEAEYVPSKFPRFKALPLNRKIHILHFQILETPSFLPKRSPPCPTDFQEFKLKTSERAMLHSSAVTKSTVLCQQSAKASHRFMVTSERGNRELASLMNASKPEACGSSHGLKALTLNKKILRSKEDIGVFHHKKELNVPSEFNFPTDKRCHHNPPIELFSQLSLAPETQPSTNLGSQLPRSTSIIAKGSKENRWGCFQQGNEIKQPSKLELSLFEGKAAI
ncbi:protein TPX2-like isoform X2 [Henckelia pumila]|uniref:protein TPX2-like isoform X2 n=1 Tax=Henckelia pumila TaxID=405737 RepID=UPI003C6E9F4F